jgi:hypothetical protein
MANGSSLMIQQWNISTFKTWKKNVLVDRAIRTEELTKTLNIWTMTTKINNSIGLMKDVVMPILYFMKELIAYLILILITKLLNLDPKNCTCKIYSTKFTSRINLLNIWKCFRTVTLLNLWRIILIFAHF